ncbi:hypothetical protein CpB0745 [Chlamydia pneumoniae TW-183]|uniref:Uncharacterized protein n=2 Tax=Chlamydia pneumoniae TaxID=83558 RepID=Q9Z7I8_CHLPN|nr:hypothetical protein [Chlamydia pneumoniae]AAD18856.1 CT656 hypothetical protein [Chlamydia pneumoniae CWL029]AAF37924.1 conserved hypothetical protein [Chlamydia pneumoniae AR39]AAP98674.1 hypothetical protein CpB0745 [Chlamydia pneumoniae TW-183]ACZ32605.1 conserved hypothetical protein [Chlamydia pneumoniae LPCoLN]ETR80626.1 hypothetical protein X556_0033 [Chlamydia pneumoniae B21]
MEPRHIYIRKPETPKAPDVEKPGVPEYMTMANTPTFEGPVKTLDQLRRALIEQRGAEEGQKMYDNFIQSILISTFGLVHKDMDRAQKASKRMRSVYKEQ